MQPNPRTRTVERPAWHENEFVGLCHDEQTQNSRCKCSNHRFVIIQALTQISDCRFAIDPGLGGIVLHSGHELPFTTVPCFSHLLPRSVQCSNISRRSPIVSTPSGGTNSARYSAIPVASSGSSTSSHEKKQSIADCRSVPLQCRAISRKRHLWAA